MLVKQYCNGLYYCVGNLSLYRNEFVESVSRPDNLNEFDPPPPPPLRHLFQFIRCRELRQAKKLREQLTFG